MKRIVSIFLLLVLSAPAVLLMGCEDGASVSKIPNSTGQSAEAESKIPDDSTQTAEAGQIQPSEANPNQASDADPTQAPDLSEIDVDITEKMYVTFINEIYVNTEDYIGKTIRIEGMYTAYTDENNGNTYYYVYRTGPGCCGNDGSMCGFEFTWNGSMPKDNDWIQVVGSLRTYDEDGFTYLTLDAKSVTVMDERGAETVYQ